MSTETSVEIPAGEPAAAREHPAPAEAHAGAQGLEGAERPAGVPLAEIVRPAEEARAPRDPRRNIDLLKDVTLRVKVELGRGKMFLRDVLRLMEGSVVELDKMAGDPVEIYANDRLVGRGEVLVLNENFCVRVTQIFSPEECLRVKGVS